MTELSLLEKLRLAHITTGQKMLGEAADRIEALEKQISEWSSPPIDETTQRLLAKEFAAADWEAAYRDLGEKE